VHQKEHATLPIESQGYDKNSRRADPNNPNKSVVIAFGKGAEKGNYEHQVVHR
jgi:hypothetical protein